MRLDKTLPYDAVLGVPGVAFQQNDRLFNQGGFLVVNGVAVVTEDDLLDELLETTPEKTAEGRETFGDEMPLERRHWKTLKAMVEAYGGEYTSKEDAIVYLQGAQR